MRMTVLSLELGCFGQAMADYPITIIHASGDITRPEDLRPTPLRHRDIISISDDCFLFERVPTPCTPSANGSLSPPVPAPTPTTADAGIPPRWMQAIAVCGTG